MSLRGQLLFLLDALAPLVRAHQATGEALLDQFLVSLVLLAVVGQHGFQARLLLARCGQLLLRLD